MEVLEGSQYDRVNETAKAFSTDLLIIETSGASGTKELFGTFAEKATREASCPVLVIPDDFKFKSPQKIGLALDAHNLENRLQLDTLFYLADNLKSRIDVVNVSDHIIKADNIHNLIYNRVKDEFD